MVVVEKMVGHLPIGVLNNLYLVHGVETVDEGIVLLDTKECDHLNVVRLLDGRFVCLKCQETKNKSFGKNII